MSEPLRFPTKLAALGTFLCILISLSPAPGQSPAPKETPSASGPATPPGPNAEVTTHEAQPLFKIQAERNLVIVRVVVRDPKGQVLSTLGKEDFRLFDNGKPQTITHFAVEVPTQGPQKPRTPKETEPELAVETRAPVGPERYVALFFDDIHMVFEDIALTRAAADHFLEASLQESDRAGIFTTSGQAILDFTGDRTRLHEVLRRLFPHPIIEKEANACPDIGDYQAHMIVDRHDPFALEIATEESVACHYSTEAAINPDAAHAQAQQEAEAEAYRALNRSEMKVDHVLRGLEQVVRRMTTLPGQRNIVVVSPGFVSLNQETRIGDVVERALRSNVIISTLDSKGLFAPIPLGNVNEQPVFPMRADMAGHKAQLILDGYRQAVEVLDQLAEDTGGFGFKNNNDLNEGFRRVAAVPAVSYVLGFSPQNLRLDGRLHNLKVRIPSVAHATIQARRGYYAPRKAQNPGVQAKEEIEQALFSQDELSEIPVEVHTQFFRVSDLDAKLSVLAHVDLRFVRFRKEEGRNLNNLTVVTALFDRDGRYLDGKEKRLEFRLFDGTLDRLSKSGLTMKTSFDVKPGTYLVRLVVRDTEGDQLSGLSRTVEIPY